MMVSLRMLLILGVWLLREEGLGAGMACCGTGGCRVFVKGDMSFDISPELRRGPGSCWGCSWSWCDSRSDSGWLADTEVRAEMGSWLL